MHRRSENIGVFQQFGIGQIKPEGLAALRVQLLQGSFGLNLRPAVDETEGNVRHEAGTDATARRPTPHQRHEASPFAALAKRMVSAMPGDFWDSASR